MLQSGRRRKEEEGVSFSSSSSTSYPYSLSSNQNQFNGQLVTEYEGYDSEDSDGVDEENSQRLTHRQRREGLAKNAIADQIAGMSDATVLGIIFSLFLTKATELFLHVTGKFIFFSLAALANIALSATAWNQARLDGWKRGSVVKAVMQTLFTIPITIAVAGSLLPFVGAAFPLFPTVIAPIMFSATLSIKFLYQSGAAVYYWGKSTGEHWGESNSDFRDHELPEFKKIKYREMSKYNAIFAVSTGFAVAAIMTVFLYLKTEYAPLGMIASAIGLGANGWLLGKNFFGGTEDLVTGQQNTYVHKQEEELGNEHGHTHDHRKEHVHSADNQSSQLGTDGRLNPSEDEAEEEEEEEAVESDVLINQDTLQKQQSSSEPTTPTKSSTSSATVLQLMQPSSTRSTSLPSSAASNLNGDTNNGRPRSTGTSLLSKVPTILSPNSSSSSSALPPYKGYSLNKPGNDDTQTQQPVSNTLTETMKRRRK